MIDLGRSRASLGETLAPRPSSPCARRSFERPRMNLAQILDPRGNGRLLPERALSPELPAPRRGMVTAEPAAVRTHRAETTAERLRRLEQQAPDRRRPQPGVLKAKALALLAAIRTRPGIKFDAIVSLVSEIERGDAKRSTRKQIAVRVTNLHQRGYLSRTGGWRNYRYKVIV